MPHAQSDRVRRETCGVMVYRRRPHAWRRDVTLQRLCCSQGKR